MQLMARLDATMEARKLTPENLTTRAELAVLCIRIRHRPRMIDSFLLRMARPVSGTIVISRRVAPPCYVQYRVNLELIRNHKQQGK